MKKLGIVKIDGAYYYKGEKFSSLYNAYHAAHSDINGDQDLYVSFHSDGRISTNA